MSELSDAIDKLKDFACNHKLYQNVISTKGNIVISRGNLNKPLFLFIGEAPGQNENKLGKPFVGRSGKLLDNWMNSFEIEDYAIINTVPIIPLDIFGKIRKPTRLEIADFRPYIDDLIKEIDPQYIICLGKSALEYMGLDLENCNWKKDIGFIYHPSFYLRRGQDGLNDFGRLLEKLNKEKDQKKLGEF